MPIGEFFDLEALAKHCAETGRYTFFFSSWTLNILVLERVGEYLSFERNRTKELW